MRNLLVPVLILCAGDVMASDAHNLLTQDDLTNNAKTNTVSVISRAEFEFMPGITQEEQDSLKEQQKIDKWSLENFPNVPGYIIDYSYESDTKSDKTKSSQEEITKFTIWKTGQQFTKDK